MIGRRSSPRGASTGMGAAGAGNAGRPARSRRTCPALGGDHLGSSARARCVLVRSGFGHLAFVAWVRCHSWFSPFRLGWGAGPGCAWRVSPGPVASSGSRRSTARSRRYAPGRGQRVRYACTSRALGWPMCSPARIGRMLGTSPRPARRRTARPRRGPGRSARRAPRVPPGTPGSGAGIRCARRCGAPGTVRYGCGLRVRAQQVRQRGTEAERDHRQAGHEHDDRPRRPGRSAAASRW